MRRKPRRGRGVRGRDTDADSDVADLAYESIAAVLAVTTEQVDVETATVILYLFLAQGMRRPKGSCWVSTSAGAEVMAGVQASLEELKGVRVAKRGFLPHCVSWSGIGESGLVACPVRCFIAAPRSFCTAVPSTLHAAAWLHVVALCRQFDTGGFIRTSVQTFGVIRHRIMLNAATPLHFMLPWFIAMKSSPSPLSDFGREVKPC